MRWTKVIGPADDPLLKRWELFRMWRLPRVYLHRFYRSDYDRALHNHPWWFISILLYGSYIEHQPDRVIRRRAPSIAYRPLPIQHRVELDNGGCWSLVITGPVVRSWGFFCPDGYVDIKEFEGC